MKELKFSELSKDAMEQLTRTGAFLTVKNGEELNTMTIGWGTIGYIWNMPIIMVPVRYSRHTYKMIENTDEFTVSIPVKKNMDEALIFCGTKSGRDFDKFKELGLTAEESVELKTPIIAECDMHLECRIVHKQAMEPALLDKDIKASKYPNNNYHVMYYGEIVRAYKK